MVQSIYGFLSPANGSTVDPIRKKFSSDRKEFSFEISVSRENLNTWEHRGCPECSNHRDMIILRINKKPVFFDCPCGHKWIEEEEKEGGDLE